MTILIISELSSGRIQVVRDIDPDDGASMMGNIAFNAVPVAHANTYDEACQIVKDIESGVKPVSL